MTLTREYAAWSPEQAEEIVAPIALTPGPILRCLQAIQERFGYVPADAVALVAQRCNATRADVHGVLTYYADLRTQPPAAIPVRLCAAEACQAVGGRELQREWEQACEADRRLAELTGGNEPVFCLGNCALGPAALVGDRLLGHASVERIEAAVGRLHEQQGRQEGDRS